MDPLRVLVADDSPVYRKILIQAVEATGVATVVHTASNGSLAIERLENGVYDAVLLDLNMPVMDGMQALPIIKARWPSVAVIVISGVDGGSAAVTLRALRNGALDFIVKPLDQDYNRNMETVRSNLQHLFAQVRLNRINGSAAKRVSNAAMPAPKPAAHTSTSIDGVDLIVIASSTGGPMVLESIFENFGESFHKPMLLVQHMPPNFTRALAQSLSKKSRMPFKEAEEGDIVRAGQCLVAPGGYHLEVRRQSKAQVTAHLQLGPAENGVRPAADVLFRSVAEAYAGMRVLSVILTGMGADGTKGLQVLKQKCRCYCITQNEASSVIYGMPRSVKEMGMSDEELDYRAVAARLQIIAEHGS